jgi:guanylate kinase
MDGSDMDLDKVNFDNEVLAYLSNRKNDLIESHEEYILSHPEIREVLNDFLSSVLLHKPDDVFVYAKEYFHPFNPTPLRGKPFILVGPSGVGKDVLLKEIFKKYEGIFEKKISYTTRPEKKIEKNKSNYYLVSREEFQKKISAGDFVEYKEINGHLYGTCSKEIARINDAGRIPIIEVDVKGAIDINKTGLEGNFLFVYPPSFEELRKRIGYRIETEEEFKKRIEAAITEIELANNSVLFTNRLVNDKLDKAVDQFFTLIEALYFQEISNFKKFGSLNAPEKVNDDE